MSENLAPYIVDGSVVVFDMFGKNHYGIVVKSVDIINGVVKVYRLDSDLKPMIKNGRVDSLYISKKYIIESVK